MITYLFFNPIKHFLEDRLKRLKHRFEVPHVLGVTRKELRVVSSTFPRDFKE
jgi:hypothetical protein